MVSVIRPGRLTKVIKYRASMLIHLINGASNLPLQFFKEPIRAFNAQYAPGSL